MSKRRKVIVGTTLGSLAVICVVATPFTTIPLWLGLSCLGMGLLAIALLVIAIDEEREEREERDEPAPEVVSPPPRRKGSRGRPGLPGGSLD
jgi:hypothetical protein